MYSISCATLLVLLPYKITLLSNPASSLTALNLFYYLIKLHYSQTLYSAFCSSVRFYYLIKLHYSQTSNFEIMTLLISAIIRQNPYLYYITSFQYSQSDNAHVCINYSFLLAVKPIAVMAVYAYQRKPAQQHAFIQLICLLISQTAAQSDNKENALL